MPDNDDGRFSCYHTPIRLVCNLLWKNFYLNAMSVALLAISFFGTLILLSCNTDPPVKFLIVIILVVQEINFFYRNSGKWRLGGGGRWLVGAQNSVPSAAVKKQRPLQQ